MNQSIKLTKENEMRAIAMIWNMLEPGVFLDARQVMQIRAMLLVVALRINRRTTTRHM